MISAVTNEAFEAARLGDRNAIVQLLERAQPDVRRYARATCLTSFDAEDATQNTLWQLSRHVGAIRVFAALSTWLFNVVKRECMRLAHRSGMVLPIDEAMLEARFSESPEVELRLDLASAFEALPQHYREIAVMCDLREMTIDEIAGALGLSRQAVKARLHRARLLLREYLAR